MTFFKKEKKFFFCFCFDNSIFRTFKKKISTHKKKIKKIKKIKK